MRWGGDEEGGEGACQYHHGRGSPGGPGPEQN